MGDIPALAAAEKLNFFCDVFTYDALRQVVQYCKSHEVPLKILGYGTDVIILDEGVKGAVIRLMGEPFWRIERLDEFRLVAGSRTALKRIIQMTQKLGLSGAEHFAGIPASLGGAISLNAGAYGKRIADIIQTITVYNPHTDEIKNFNKDDLTFEYRHGPFYHDEIVLEAVLKFEKGDPDEIRKKAEAIQKVRDTKLPHGKSAGCIFKNPQEISAGALIEMAGWKGRRLNDAVVSEKHANIIINEENARSGDVLRLIEEVKQSVLKEKGINLDLEVKIWS